MGLTVYLNVQQCDDVVFDDLNALNDDLAGDYGISQLIDYYDDKTPNPEFTGWVRQSKDGSVEIARSDDHTFESYGDSYIEVWGCWSTKAAQIIANHMVSGKLVLLLDIEGNDNEYYIITPNEVVVKNQSDIRF